MSISAADSKRLITDLGRIQVLRGSGKWETADIRVGDIVSWEGSDAHEVTSIDGQAGQLPARVEVRCIRAAPGFQQESQSLPDQPWAKVGDVNWLSADEVDLITRDSALPDKPFE